MRQRPDVDRVRELARCGATDHEIGKQFGYTAGAIWVLRKKHGIAPGVAPMQGRGGGTKGQLGRRKYNLQGNGDYEPERPVKVLEDESIWTSRLAGQTYVDHPAALAERPLRLARPPSLRSTGESSMAWAG